MIQSQRPLRFAALLLGLSLALVGCAPASDPEQRLAQTIEAMEVAIEARERGTFMDYVADDFAGQRGRYDRTGLDGMVRLHLIRNKSVSATVMGSELQITGERATAEINVLLTGGAGWLPERGQLYSVTTGWRMEDDDWRLIQAHWEPAL